MSRSRVRILVINGPNLNLLGSRQPDVYGTETLADLERRLRARAVGLDCDLEMRQSNLEGEIVGWLQEAGKSFDAVVMNPGAYAHYSYAIRDAVTAARVRLFEVHLSNVYAREEFRHRSVIAPVAAGIVVGMGTLGYELALEAAVRSARA
ncbi:MAG TPA: type II 3-dehydroquinate dehydratase [Candidatus Dormibacteraeota bacterium]|jgi:3-dehydroquinate dehydratase-2|nr:type II 3-dehydroquinate dehydratase [Candidatus Dormibacteraeota bacterium]